MRRPTFYVLSVLSLAAVFGQSLLAQAANTKPEDILKQMADYLGKLPKYSCHLESSLDIKAPNEQEQHQVTKMTARVERPNKLALTVTGGQMGLSIISDGKQLTQFLPVLNRYAISEAPASYAEMAAHLREAGGFARAGWCGGEECEARVKADSAATIRCLPLGEAPAASDRCIVCGRPSEAVAVWALAY